MLLPIVLASASVFHGTPVPAEQAPWFASLTTRAPFCGAALIAPDRVVTAAHCVQGADPDRVSVRINGQRRPWKGALFATTYRELPSPTNPDDPSASGTLDDLAVLVLKEPVTDVAPLPIARSAATTGEATLTIGRGRTGPAVEQTGPDTPDPGASGKGLRSASQVVSGDCPSAYGAKLFFPAKHLCTLDPTTNAAQACAGDSGSPVMVQRDGAWAIAAVVTWGGETYGRDCGEGLPDVSERLDAHAELLTTTRAVAPYAAERVRVRRTGSTRRCVIGKWTPAKATFKFRWWRQAEDRFDGERLHAGKRTPVNGTGETLRVSKGKVGCSVTATSAGGWATEDSYNQL